MFCLALSSFKDKLSHVISRIEMLEDWWRFRSFLKPKNCFKHELARKEGCLEWFFSRQCSCWTFMISKKVLTYYNIFVGFYCFIVGTKLPLVAICIWPLLPYGGFYYRTSAVIPYYSLYCFIFTVIALLCLLSPYSGCYYLAWSSYLGYYQIIFYQCRWCSFLVDLVVSMPYSNMSSICYYKFICRNLAFSQPLLWNFFSLLTFTMELGILLPAHVMEIDIPIFLSYKFILLYYCLWYYCMYRAFSEGIEQSVAQISNYL